MTGSSSEGYVRFLGSYFRIAGLERDDVEQEARLAAYLAPAGLERVAARRRVLDLLNASRRLKRGQLEPLEIEPASTVDVLGAVCARETLREILAVPMSGSEAEAVGRVLRGEPIRRHEHRLGMALYRFRTRVRVDST